MGNSLSMPQRYRSGAYHVCGGAVDGGEKFIDAGIILTLFYTARLFYLQRYSDPACSAGSKKKMDATLMEEPINAYSGI